MDFLIWQKDEEMDYRGKEKGFKTGIKVYYAHAITLHQECKQYALQTQTNKI